MLNFFSTDFVQTEHNQVTQGTSFNRSIYCMNDISFKMGRPGILSFMLISESMHVIFSMLIFILLYRTTMTEDRLNGLAFLYIHRGMKIDINEAVQKFAMAKPRRLQFSSFLKRH